MTERSDMNAEPCARCGAGRWWHPDDGACGEGPPCECDRYVPQSETPDEIRKEQGSMDAIAS